MAEGVWREKVLVVGYWRDWNGNCLRRGAAAARDCPVPGCPQRLRHERAPGWAAGVGLMTKEGHKEKKSEQQSPTEEHKESHLHLAVVPKAFREAPHRFWQVSFETEAATLDWRTLQTVRASLQQSLFSRQLSSHQHEAAVPDGLLPAFPQ